MISLKVKVKVNFFRMILINKNMTLLHYIADTCQHKFRSLSNHLKSVFVCHVGSNQRVCVAAVNQHSKLARLSLLLVR